MFALERTHTGRMSNMHHITHTPPRQQLCNNCCTQLAGSLAIKVNRQIRFETWSWRLRRRSKSNSRHLASGCLKWVRFPPGLRRFRRRSHTHCGQNNKSKCVRISEIDGKNDNKRGNKARRSLNTLLE